MAYLTLTASPEDCQIYIDGILVGASPFDSLRVQPGVHKIDVKKNNFIDFGEEFTFQAVAQTPAGEIVLAFNETVAGDSMEGAWESEDSAYAGEWTATRE